MVTDGERGKKDGGAEKGRMKGTRATGRKRIRDWQMRQDKKGYGKAGDQGGPRAQGRGPAPHLSWCTPSKKALRTFLLVTLFCTFLNTLVFYKRCGFCTFRSTVI